MRLLSSGLSCWSGLRGVGTAACSSPSAEELFQGLVSGQRQSLARAITLVESTNARKASEARNLMASVQAHLRKKHTDTRTFRIGLSGPPGAGKSTFIEAIGNHILKQEELQTRLAVLAVDPSSSTTGGSMLGDKTRMNELSRSPRAYVRPSPSRGHLGGVTRNTNEAIMLCEAAGYDTVLVETVGVGQSEYVVADMVDVFCLIIPPASGDELQAIKKGIVEQSDLIIINKCDGDLIQPARRVKAEYLSATKYMRPKHKEWATKVMMVSSLNGEGLNEVWEQLQAFRQTMLESGAFEKRRAEQRKKWMWSYIQHRLLEIFQKHPSVKEQAPLLEKAVMDCAVSAGTAADDLIERFVRK